MIPRPSGLMTGLAEAGMADVEPPPFTEFVRNRVCADSLRHRWAVNGFVCRVSGLPEG